MTEPIELLRERFKEITQTIKTAKECLNYTDKKELELLKNRYVAGINLLSHHYDKHSFVMNRLHEHIKPWMQDELRVEYNILTQEKLKLVAERNLITSKISTNTARSRTLKSHLN